MRFNDLICGDSIPAQSPIHGIFTPPYMSQYKGEKNT